MKNQKRLIFLFISAMLLSCEGVPLDTAAVSRELHVNAVREGVLQPRAATGTWSAGDAIGLFMKRSGEPLNESALAQNVKYVTTGGVNFLPENENERIIFPFNASDVDFIGYYPFSAEIVEFQYPVDVSDQSNQSAIDLLYSNNATRLNSKSPYANMVFSHQLSKIILNIRPENLTNDLSGLTATLTNTGTRAQFSLIDGTLSSPAAHGNISFKITDDGRFAEAIVLPTNDLSAKHLALELGETVYIFPLNNATNIRSFEKSTRYIYNITLNPRGASVTVDGSITDWIDGPSEDINLDPDEGGGVPDMSKGTRENPFTVDEARENQGRTGVWVEGYIVGFYSSTSFRNFVNDAVGSESVEVSQSNLALAFDINESVAENTFSVQIPTRVAIRRPLNLRENPDNFRRKVVIQGDIGAFLGTVGLRDLMDFEFVEDE
jgi:hypothetical protein